MEAGIEIDNLVDAYVAETREAAAEAAKKESIKRQRAEQVKAALCDIVNVIAKAAVTSASRHTSEPIGWNIGVPEMVIDDTVARVVVTFFRGVFEDDNVIFQTHARAYPNSEPLVVEFRYAGHVYQEGGLERQAYKLACELYDAYYREPEEE
jgi:hypothetical protein